MAKTFTIVKTRRGEPREVSGTVEELTKYFGYTLLAGNSYNRAVKLQPKTAKSLVSNLNKAVGETMSGSFDPTHYELKGAEVY
jgi:hypothetical protein